MCDEGNPICSNCGEEYEKRKGRKGLCSKCTAWMRNHGTLRPIGYTRTVTVCLNCGEPRQKGRGALGLCKNCYQFFKNNGRHRTAADSIRKRGEPPPVCRQCGIRVAYHASKQKLCKACYTYQKRHGKPRPKWRDAEKCRNCGKPRTDEPRKFYKGRCDLCNEYLRKHDAERPERFWNRGRYGYCDCGQPATHKIEIQVHKHTEELPLCDDCYAIEQQHNTWYGDGPGKNWKSGKTMWGDD